MKARKDSILGYRDSYRPYLYPKIVEMNEKMEDMIWIPSQVDMQNDLSDFREKLTDDERDCIIRILSSFTQSDAAIGNDWLILGSVLRQYEVQDGISLISYIETVHKRSYALLIETLQLEDTFDSFLSEETAKTKIDYITVSQLSVPKTPADTLKFIAKMCFGGEGIMLFSMFCILLHFYKLRNVLSGTYTVNEWSLRDETMHLYFGIELFDTIKEEYPEIWDEDLKQEIRQIIIQCALMELQFLEYVMPDDLPMLKKKSVENYIKYIADRRLIQAGVKTYFRKKKVPLSMLWMEEIIAGSLTHGNFFETRVTDYSKTPYIGEIQWEKTQN